MLSVLRLLLLPGLFLATVLLAAALDTDASRSQDDGREVLLLSQRYGEALHFFDAETLEPIGRINFDQMVEDVAVDPPSGRLFLRLGSGNGCCHFWSLDLQTLESCVLGFPAGGVTVDASGSRVYLVRGSVGIEPFDTRTLNRLPVLQGPGSYDVHPSPDGRWVYGLTRFRGPSLDVFDVSSGVLTARHFLGEPETDDVQFGGAWVDEQFFLYVHDGDSAYLRRVGPEEAPVDYRGLPLLAVEVPGTALGELPRGWSVAYLAAGERLLVFQQLGDWFKGNPRREGWSHLVDGPVLGGIFVIDVERSAAVAHLAPDTDFAFLTSDATGDRLYGLVAYDLYDGTPPRLLMLDGATGEVMAQRELEDDIWRVEHAVLPAELVPSGVLDARPVDCRW